MAFRKVQALVVITELAKRIARQRSEDPETLVRRQLLIDERAEGLVLQASSCRPIMEGKRMKQSTISVMSLLLPLLADVALAQTSGESISANDDVAQGQQMIREARVEIIRSELHLTDEEAADFWPVYAEYRAETDAIQDRYVAMVSEYLRRYDRADLTEEYADELIAKFFGIKRELFAVQEKFLPEFRDVLPSLKVARLFQLENKVNAEIDAQMALVVPLVDPS